MYCEYLNLGRKRSSRKKKPLKKLKAKTLGGSEVDIASSVQKTFDGGYIIAGFTKLTVPNCFQSLNRYGTGSHSFAKTAKSYKSTIPDGSS